MRYQLIILLDDRKSQFATYRNSDGVGFLVSMPTADLYVQNRKVSLTDTGLVL